MLCGFLPCRSFRRYFYTNTTSGESQWDYPDPASGAVSGSDQTSFVEPLQATGQEDGSKTHTIVKPKASDSNVAGLKMSAHARLEEEEDLDGVAMSDGDNEAGKVCLPVCQSLLLVTLCWYRNRK